MKSPPAWLALPCLVFLTACPTVRMQPLSTLPLGTRAGIETPRQTDQTIIVYPFEELRGPDYAHIYPTSEIPILSLLHSGARLAYPEHALFSHGGDSAVIVGQLDSALPSLLATMMRKMRLTPYAMAASDIGPNGDGRPADYVVTGKLRRATFDGQQSFAVALLLGVLGVPHLYARFDLDYDVELFRSDNRQTALLHKSYHFSDWRLGGLYYHQEPKRALLVRALEQTLPHVVEDIAIALR